MCMVFIFVDQIQSECVRISMGFVDTGRIKLQLAKFSNISSKVESGGLIGDGRPKNRQGSFATPAMLIAVIRACGGHVPALRYSLYGKEKKGEIQLRF